MLVKESIVEEGRQNRKGRDKKRAIAEEENDKAKGISYMVENMTKDNGETFISRGETPKNYGIEYSFLIYGWTIKCKN